MVSSQIICTNKPLWLGWMVVIFQALVGCHDILILGKSPIKWRQRPDMTLAVDWDVKHQLKQKNKDLLLAGLLDNDDELILLSQVCSGSDVLSFEKGFDLDTYTGGRTLCVVKAPVISEPSR